MHISLSHDHFAFSFLESYGYYAVRLPKSSIKPLQVYEKKDKVLTPFGNLKSLFRPGENVPLPHIKTNVPAANISGSKSHQVSFGGGTAVLCDLISAFIGRGTNVNAMFQKEALVSFQFENVLIDEADMVNLDKFLNDSTIDPNASEGMIEKLNSQKICVMSTTAKSRKLTVFPETSNQLGLDANISLLMGLGPKVDISRKGNEILSVTFKGMTPLIFGFKAQKLLFSKGHYKGLETLSEPEINCAPPK